MLALIKNTLSYIDAACSKFVWFTLKFMLAVALDAVILFWFVLIGWYFFTQEGMNYRVQQVYHKVLIQSGQGQDDLPLEIVNSPIDNAYNDGTKVVLYTGLLNHMANWDEVAMVLGHEIAHGMLWHLRMPLKAMTDEEVQVLEANADKMGAFYMYKAGYDICRGRMLFKYWKETKGDYLGSNHPSYAYRIDQLNINCD